MTRTPMIHGHFMRRLWCALVGVSAWHPGHNAVAEPQHETPLESTALVTAATDPEAAVEAEGEHVAPRDSANTDAFAQRHWQSGMAYLEEGEYAKALEAFTKAYELSERPSILRSIAVAHEKLGDLPSALAAIDLYLRQVPDAADINDIRTYRAELHARYDREQIALAAARETSSADATKPRLPSRYVLPKEQAPVREPQVAQTDSRAIVMWSALGLGLAAGASAVLTGVLAKSEFDQLEAACNAECTREQTHEGRTLAFASTVLAGVAVLGGGAALFAWLDDDTKPADNAPANALQPTLQKTGTSNHATSQSGWLSPHIDAGYANRRFMSYAKWRF